MVERAEKNSDQGKDSRGKRKSQEKIKAREIDPQARNVIAGQGFPIKDLQRDNRMNKGNRIDSN